MNIIDPFGHDFIAVAKRPLDFFPWKEQLHIGITIHTSIEYWECPCPIGKDKEYRKSTIKKRCKQQGFKESVELLNSPDNTWWIWEQVVLDSMSLTSNTPQNQSYWRQAKVGVSVIAYNDRNRVGNSIMAFYEPISTKKQNTIDVLTEWQNIKNKARNYKFAEQRGFGGKFQNWPNSYYQMFGNNCHTFSKTMVGNHKFPDILGHMMGNDSPQPVTDQWNKRIPVSSNTLLGLHP